MPYVRRGTSVYKKKGGKVGTSDTVDKAKEYLRTLQGIHQNQKRPGRCGRRLHG